MTGKNIHLIAELAIGEGNLETFKALAEEIAAAVKSTEPGTLSYEWYITEDGTTCYVDEWYADAQAALAHLEGEVPRLLPAVLEVSELASLTVLSDIPSRELREKLTEFGGCFTSRCCGFMRQGK